MGMGWTLAKESPCLFFMSFLWPIAGEELGDLGNLQHLWSCCSPLRENFLFSSLPPSSPCTPCELGTTPKRMSL